MDATTEAPKTPAPGDGSGTPRQRFSESVLGRSVLSALLVFTLAAMLISNLPDSQLRRSGLKVVNGFLDVTGLHQNWNLFAPDPRRITLELEAHVIYDDGAEVVWQPTLGDPIFGVYASFRWRKWASYVVNRSNASGLWSETADWIARTHVVDGRYPNQVVLIRRSYLAPEPGRGTTQPPWSEQVLYRAHYTASGERA